MAKRYIKAEDKYSSSVYYSSNESIDSLYTDVGLTKKANVYDIIEKFQSGTTVSIDAMSPLFGYPVSDRFGNLIGSEARVTAIAPSENNSSIAITAGQNTYFMTADMGDTIAVLMDATSSEYTVNIPGYSDPYHVVKCVLKSTGENVSPALCHRIPLSRIYVLTSAMPGVSKLMEFWDMPPLPTSIGGVLNLSTIHNVDKPDGSRGDFVVINTDHLDTNLAVELTCLDRKCLGV